MPTSPIQGVLGHLRRSALLDEGGAVTDGHLLGEFISRRDEAAFTCLVRRHGPMVLGVCQRLLRHRQDAEDAFQATFLVLARKAGSVQPRDRVASWLYGVAYRTALEARRLAARRRARERQVEEMPQPAVAPEDPGQDLRLVLDEELSRLPGKYRLPVVLCDLEGRTRKETALQLGVPEGTLSNRLAAARRLLARRLFRRGVTLSASVTAAALSPEVPAALAAATVKAAVAPGGVATVVVSANVAALTKGVLKAMFLSKLKVASAVLVLAGALGGVGAAFLHDPAQARGPEEDPPSAKAPDRGKAALAAAGGARRVPVVERGTVEAARVSDLICKGADSTIKWLVEDGTQVRKGDLLVQLDDRTLREQFRECAAAVDKARSATAEAEANLALAREEKQLASREGENEVKLARLRLKRYTGDDALEKEERQLMMEKAQLALKRRNLRARAKEARAESLLKARVTALDQETARLRALEARLADCTLRAPHDGVAVHFVVQLAGRAPGRGAAAPIVAVGEPVRAGQKLVQVHALDTFVLRTNVHEAVVAQLRAGQPASIRIDTFPGRVLQGKIKSVSPQASQEAWLARGIKVYPVEVELTERLPGLKPGMTGEVRIDAGRGREAPKPDGRGPGSR
jgi:RNA polymerase sigma factor (sigma-70 family)